MFCYRVRRVVDMRHDGNYRSIGIQKEQETDRGRRKRHPFPEITCVPRSLQSGAHPVACLQPVLYPLVDILYTAHDRQMKPVNKISMEEKQLAENIMKQAGSGLMGKSEPLLPGSMIADRYLERLSKAGYDISRFFDCADAIRHYVICAGYVDGKFEFRISEYRE